MASTTHRKGPVPGTAKARHGGEAVKAKYGPDHFREIGRKGGAAVLEKHGPEHFSRMGKAGGDENIARHGTQRMAEIGRRGGQSRPCSEPGCQQQATTRFVRAWEQSESLYCTNHALLHEAGGDAQIAEQLRLVEARR